MLNGNDRQSCVSDRVNTAADSQRRHFECQFEPSFGRSQMGRRSGHRGIGTLGHWLGGLLMSNECAGVNHNHVNEFTMNPFLYYNFQRGSYLVSSEIMTADWTASRNQRWTVPAGGCGVGKIFRLGPQMLNARVQAWSVTQRPDRGPNWILQTQLQLLYPHKRE
jgi:hypothetical protein